MLFSQGGITSYAIFYASIIGRSLLLETFFEFVVIIRGVCSQGRPRILKLLLETFFEFVVIIRGVCSQGRPRILKSVKTPVLFIFV